jgi:hypothetical protein
MKTEKSWTEMNQKELEEVWTTEVDILGGEWDCLFTDEGIGFILDEEEELVLALIGDNTFKVFNAEEFDACHSFAI